MKAPVFCKWLFVVLVAIGVWPPSASAVDVKTYVPKNAEIYLPTLKLETARLFPELHIPWYMGSLIEQESCISLTHRRCWLPSSQLKTSRETGAGLLQITKAYTSTGKVRFDTLSDLRRKYPAELYELTWTNVYDRPDLQIRAGILLSKDNWKALYDIKGPLNRVAMADSAYNGGLGNLQKSRRVCGLQAKCDPQLWFGNVEHTLVQSRVAIYGTRSANFINQEHVYSVMKVRLEKYKRYFTDEQNTTSTPPAAVKVKLTSWPYRLHWHTELDTTRLPRSKKH